jgi:hypothetical protein
VICAAKWVCLLDHLLDVDLGRRATSPWQDDATEVVAHTIAWLNIELTKNVAEIGQLRLMRDAARA